MMDEVPHQTSAIRKSLKAFALLHCAKVMDMASEIYKTWSKVKSGRMPVSVAPASAAVHACCTGTKRAALHRSRDGGRYKLQSFTTSHHIVI